MDWGARGVNHEPGDFALAAHAAASAELRATPRYALLIRTAKLVTRAGEFLCVLRDVSATGIKVKIFHPLPLNPWMELEIAEGERFAVEKMWEAPGSAGFRFAEPVEVGRFVADPAGGLRKRSVRLRCIVPATLAAGGETVAAEIRNISQQGACIACDRRLAIDERIQLESDFLPPLEATVRWRRHPLHGLIFKRSFGFEELARLVAAAQAHERAEQALRPAPPSAPPLFAAG